MKEKFTIPVYFVGKKYIWYKVFGALAGALIPYSFYDETTKKLKLEVFDPTAKLGIKESVKFARIDLGGRIIRNGKVIGSDRGLTRIEPFPPPSK